MDIKLLFNKLTENIFPQRLRHIWRPLIFVFLRIIYLRIYETKKKETNNNNIMDQDINEDLQALVDDDNVMVIADNNNIENDLVEEDDLQPPDVENMEVSDIEEDEDDVGEEEDNDDDDADDASDQDFDEMYSSAGEDDGEWTSSNESEDSTTPQKQIQQQQQQLVEKLSIQTYAFRPLTLIRCSYKQKHKFGEFPLARSGHRVIASNSHLYSLGGYNPRSALTAARTGQCLLFQELWSYNFASNHWKLEMNANIAKDMPVELASNALAIHNNVLISHGGTGYPFGESCSNDCYVYTTGSKSTVMRLKVTGELPTAQYGPGIVIHNNYLYTIGGTTGFDYSCDVYRLNLATKVWENVYICRPEMRDDPEGRYRHEVVYDGNHIFVLGGGTSHSVYDLQRIPAYNLNDNCWNYFDTLPDRTMVTPNDAGYPKPRKCFSCVQHKLSNGDIEAFITGGLQGDFSTYFSDIWKLNLSTKQWSRIVTATFPKPLYFHSAAHSDNGCMYIFGGIEYSDKDMRRRNDLYKMWMTIPKLSEMCWEALTFYNEKLHCYNRKTLLNNGIPIRFIERLSPAPKKLTHLADSVIGSSAKRARSMCLGE